MDFKSATNRLPMSEYNNKIWRNRNANNGFYDFIWTREPKNTYGNYRYNMYALVLQNSEIQLESIEIEIDGNNDFSYNGHNSKSLGEKKNTPMDILIMIVNFFIG